VKKKEGVSQGEKGEGARKKERGGRRSGQIIAKGENEKKPWKERRRREVKL